MTLLAGALACARDPGRPDPLAQLGDQPNIVLITYCTMRADRFGAYGSQAGLTPNLDQLAAESQVFRRHYSQASFSGASFASIITGKYPLQHGVYDHPRWLDDSQVTLAEHLGTAGYRTGAFLTHGYISPKFNYVQGVEVYNGVVMARFEDRRGREQYAGRPLGRPYRRVKEARNWLEQVGQDPFFLWVQTQETHFLPRPPLRFIPEQLQGDAAAFQARVKKSPRDRLKFDYDSLDFPDNERQAALALYDAAVRQSDEFAGMIVEKLRELDLMSDTIVIVTADHGETLGDHGLNFTHDANVYEPVIRVPLLVRIPGVAAKSWDLTTRAIDLFPTISEMAGLEVTGDLDGSSLLDILRGHPREVPAFSETRPTDAARLEAWGDLPGYRFEVEGVFGKQRMVRRGEYKLILYPKSDGYEVELYNLAADPEELENLAEKESEIAGRMLAALNEWFAGYATADTSPLELDEEDIESLKALGYLN